jgi:transcriptional regulator with XRE-family HTH domain
MIHTLGGKMPRKTTLTHPVAQLRMAAKIGRKELSAWMGIARVTLEKIERGERTLSAVHIERIFRATGICPGWLANPQGPMHTADGYPFTLGEHLRWRSWAETKTIPRPSRFSAPAPADAVSFGYPGRLTGPHHGACCPDGKRLHPLTPPDAKLTLAERRIAEKIAREADLKQLKHDLVDLARGVTIQAGSDPEVLIEALYALRKLCPKACITPDPRDLEELKSLGLSQR